MSSISVPLSDYATPASSASTNLVRHSSSYNAYYFVGGIILFIVVNGIWWYAYNKQSRTMKSIQVKNDKLLANLKAASELQQFATTGPGETRVRPSIQV